MKTKTLPALPAFALTLHNLPKTARPVAAFEDHRALRRAAPETGKDYFTFLRDSSLLSVNECRETAHKLREHFAAFYGDSRREGPDLCRFPVSGGICDHWPEAAKEAVVSAVRRAQDFHALAYSAHRAAGYAHHTFARL